jgi:acyl-coenzyme A thioesterase PaaI-like protein
MGASRVISLGNAVPPGTGYTMLETKGNFTGPITPETGRVRAEGHVVAQGRTVITAEGQLRSAQGRVLAHGTSTVLVLAEA